MNSKHRKTVEAIRTRPTVGSLKWSAIESLFIYLGARIIEGRGSHIGISVGGTLWRTYRPHPGKEAMKYQVEHARELLDRLGV